MAPQTGAAPWRTLSIPAGNAIQLGGLATAGTLVLRARRAGSRGGTALLVLGWLMAYFTSHAIAHWAVGRLCGIRFVAYGLRGTTNPAWYPPGVRWIFLHLPFLSARTDPASRRAARPAARAAMYAAGPLSTVLATIGIPLYGRAAGIRHAAWLLAFARLWIAGMLVGELAPHSDLRRAWRALKSATPTSPPS